MAPAAITSDNNDQDLQFLAEIKNEIPSDKIAPRGDSTHPQDPLYLGMRRNSSFADYFEGDLSQNLLSRRFFPSSSASSSSSSDHQHQEVIDSLVNKIQNDNKLSSTSRSPSETRIKKFSEVESKQM